MRAALRWAADWRNGAVILGAVLVAYLGILVVTSIQDRSRALDATIAATGSEREARAAAVHRIDQLLTEIKALQADAEANGAQIATLTQEVDLLEQQVRDLGGQPVVTTSSSGGTSTTVSAHPTPHNRPSSRPTPSSTPTHRPSPTPTPTKTCTVHVGPVCV